MNDFQDQFLNFKSFNPQNSEHLKVQSIVENDPLVQSFFPEWREITSLSINDDSKTYYSYMVSINNEIIALCTVVFINDEKAVFSQTVLPNYRNHNYANMIRQSVLKHLYSKGVKEVNGYIRKDNERIIRNLEKNGYKVSEIPGQDLLQVTYLNEERTSDKNL